MRVRSAKIYNAVLYKPGDEDGFSTMYYDPEDPERYFQVKESIREIAVEIPYINSDGYIYYIFKDDFILTNEKTGNKIVITAAYFNNNFEEISFKSDCKCKYCQSESNNTTDLKIPL